MLLYDDRFGWQWTSRLLLSWRCRNGLLRDCNRCRGLSGYGLFLYGYDLLRLRLRDMNKLLLNNFLDNLRLLGRSGLDDLLRNYLRLHWLLLLRCRLRLNDNLRWRCRNLLRLDDDLRSRCRLLRLLNDLNRL